MDWEHMEGDRWRRVGASLQRHWAKLSGEDLGTIAGRRDHLIERIRALYGLTELRAEAELRNWERHQEPIELPH